MTRIEIERKPRRSFLPLLLALVVIALVAVGVYFYLENERRAAAEAPAAPAPGDTTGSPPAGLRAPSVDGEQLVRFAGSHSGRRAA
jgi:hypothetical protein